MEKQRVGYILAINPETKQFAVRAFLDEGRGELDYENELDSVCYEVGWNAVWCIHYGALTMNRVSVLVRSMEAYASGGDDAWCNFAETEFQFH